MWEEITSPQNKFKYAKVNRQNLETLDINYGTISVREDLAKEMVDRNNLEESGFNWWYE